MLKNLSDDTFSTKLKTDSNYFVACASKLEPMTIEKRAEFPPLPPGYVGARPKKQKATIKGKVSIKNVMVNNSNLLGSGTYGETYLGKTTKRLWKRVRLFPDETPLNLLCRDFFLEVLAQVIASNDPTVGRQICGILKVYRDKAVHDDADPNARILLYIEMEYMPLSLTDYIQSMSPPTKSSFFNSIIEPLATTMYTLEKRYNFHHNDLHTGNVMYKPGAGVKIIDFGMACFKIGGKAYTPLKLLKDCEMSDFAIFIASCIRYAPRNVSAELKRLLQTLLTPPGSTRNLYDWAMMRKAEDAKKEKYETVYFYYYFWYIPPPDDIRAEIKSITPEFILRSIGKPVPVVGSLPKSKSKTKSQNKNGSGKSNGTRKNAAGARGNV